MRHIEEWTRVLVVIIATAMTPAAYGAETQAGQLTPKEIAEGWIQLFDGATTFGWKAEGDARVEGGAVIVGSEKAATLTNTTEFGDFELRFEAKGGKRAAILLDKTPHELSESKDWTPYTITITSKDDFHKVEIIRGNGASASRHSMNHPGASRMKIGFQVEPGAAQTLRNIRLKPLGTKSLFSGKDLSGWTPIAGKPSEFTVTDKGELNIKNGPGDIQTEGQWADFALQLDILSSGEHLNSGVFFRATPGEFWRGYEVQIRNEWKGYEGKKPRDPGNEDRTKPVDYGTGGVYNRQPSRKVVSNDNEWYTMTIVAGGPHTAVWVNGYQTADYVDEQKDAPTPRKGRFLGKGCISLQGHDPTTNMSFRHIRLAELPKGPAKKAESK